jgi:Cft2 family RNA processing exonuclease/predicted lipoprotein with Yx(FWY)xxD motif
MEIHFLGGATTVTGSQYLLETGQARILIDCGMFQGSPNESIRNRIPFEFDPTTLDAVLLTHAHLDHCGLLPLLVKVGYRGPILATPGTIELAGLVLLDSGKLHEEFAKRDARWEKRHPDEAAAEDREAEDRYAAAIALAEAGESNTQPPPQLGGPREADDGEAIPPIAQENGQHVETTIEPVRDPSKPETWPRDPEADLRAQPPALDVDLDAPLYTARDAERSLASFRPIGYGEEREVAPGIHATFLDAGHILGSAIIRLRVQDAPGGEERVIVCSGDLGRPGTPILRDPSPLDAADYVLVESTYGGREHEPEGEAVRLLAETVRMVAEANGVLLVPSFAIGRTQEVVWELDRLIERGEIPLLPLYLDSPMASKASDIYRHHPDDYDEETAKLLRDGASPLDYPNQIVTNDVKASQAIERAPRPYMIVASNGMLTGGRVVGHLRNLIGDPAATILFVGYQGEGTLGAHLQAGATTVKLDGQVRQVRCKIRSISGFSAHADEGELLAWPVRRREAPRRRGLPAQGLPRPRRPGGPDRHGAQGPSPRLRDPCPALARAGRPRLTRGDRGAVPAKPTGSIPPYFPWDADPHEETQGMNRLVGPMALLIGIVAVIAACTSSGASTAPSAAAPSAAAPSAAASAEASAPAAGAATLALADSALGKIVVDGQGKTLYMFEPDDGQAAPTCVADCATNWPALISSGTPSVGDGITAAASTVARTDGGGDQVKLGDYPLYYFAADKAAGDTNGQGIGGKWFVVGADGEPIKTTSSKGSY